MAPEPESIRVSVAHRGWARRTPSVSLKVVKITNHLDGGTFLGVLGSKWVMDHYDQEAFEGIVSWIWQTIFFSTEAFPATKLVYGKPFNESPDLKKTVSNAASQKVFRRPIKLVGKKPPVDQFRRQEASRGSIRKGLPETNSKGPIN